jgi:hypothetical protein
MEIISKYLNFLSITLYYNLEYHLSLFYNNQEICHKIQKAIDKHLRGLTSDPIQYHIC